MARPRTSGILLPPALCTALVSAALFGPASAAFPPLQGRVPLIRIGVAIEVSELRVASEGAWALGISGKRLRPTRIAHGEEWTFRVAANRVVVADASGKIRGQVEDTLYAFPEDMETGRLRINGTTYRGQFLIAASPGGLTGINVLDLESYLRAVVPLEMGPQAPARFEALKAQAVAARSYTLAMLGRWQARGFDLLATVEDQVYGGFPSERQVCSNAVEETRGVVAVHHGQPIHAFYCSTCGGHTAAPEEVWQRPRAPYLQAVRDKSGRSDASFCAASPWFHWEETWKGSEFEAMLQKSLPRLGTKLTPARLGAFRGLSIRDRSTSMRVACLRLEFQRGNVDLRGDEIRWVIRRAGTGDGLRSCLLNKAEVKRRKGRVTQVRIVGQGYGHGIGMCQFGAMGMSQAGYRYEQILQFYYRDVELRRFY